MEEPRLREVLRPYLIRWKWFLFWPFLLTVFSILYIQNTSPAYRIISTVLIKDSKSLGGEYSVLSNISGMGKLGSDQVENEVIVFQSKELMTSVIKELELECNVYREGFFRNTELYKESSPIIVKLINEKKVDKFSKKPIKVTIKGNSLTLSSSELDNDISSEFGKVISLPFANIMILKNENYDIKKTNDTYLNQVLITINSLEGTVEDFQDILKVAVLNKDVTVIELSMAYLEKNKGKDIINKLVANYNRNALSDKNLESQKTAEFIEDRIIQIGKDLGNIEDEKERFKEKNDIADLGIEASIGLQLSVETQQKLLELENQIDITNSLLNYINKQGVYEVLPTGTGVDSETVSKGIAEYNQLVLERGRLLQNATLDNPLVEEISRQIREIRSSIVESIVKTKNGLLSTKTNIEREQRLLTNKIDRIPLQERLFRGIERQQKIKENLYLMLLQKREETNITLAMSGEKARIIDHAYASLKPVAPKKILILLGALFLGFLIPLGIVYLIEILDNKIKSKQDIDKFKTGIPVIAEIPKVDKNTKLVDSHDTRPLAESFRILSTNMKFILPNNNQGKVVMLTSSVKGEGKTFVSVNLGLTLSSPKHRVVLIGSDIRNPQLQRYNKESKNYAGLTEYLYEDDMDIEKLIYPFGTNANLDVIYSGMIPPNPTELLSNGKFKILLNTLKQQYDYVLVDTAPLMLVADTFLISDLADIMIYVMRSMVSQKSYIEFIENNVVTGNLKNVALLLNDVSKDLLAYGNKYGYGYSAEEKNYFTRLKERIFR